MSRRAPVFEGCVACGARGTDLVSEWAHVRSNVRAFRHQAFALWRCAECLSIHAKDEVALAHYYARYPFHALPDDWRVQLVYDHQVARLRQVGIGPEHHVLDYGAGSGAFIRHLQRRGFRAVSAYDQYCKPFSDTAVLRKRYDCVVSQDVLEHVPDPDALFDRLGTLVHPGGLIAIGTPNAAALDLRRPERHTHALHAPYHRHILSKSALFSAGERRGWRVENYFATQYTNTRVPFLNARFYRYYTELLDGSLDCLMEPPRLWPLLTHLPLTVFWALFGSWFAEETDVMIVFRR